MVGLLYLALKAIVKHLDASFQHDKSPYCVSAW